MFLDRARPRSKCAVRDRDHDYADAYPYLLTRNHAREYDIVKAEHYREEPYRREGGNQKMPPEAAGFYIIPDLHRLEAETLINARTVIVRSRVRATRVFHGKVIESVLNDLRLERDRHRVVAGHPESAAE